MACHKENLRCLCRLCGGTYNVFPSDRAPVHKGGQYKSAIKAAFGIDVDDEDETVFPLYVCKQCCSKLRNWYPKRRKKNAELHITLFSYSAHSDNCEVCLVTCPENQQVSLVFPDHPSYIKMSEDQHMHYLQLSEDRVRLRLVISPDGMWYLYVHGTEYQPQHSDLLSDFHKPLSNEDLPKLLDFIASQYICPVSFKMPKPGMRKRIGYLHENAPRKKRAVKLQQSKTSCVNSTEDTTMLTETSTPDVSMKDKSPLEKACTTYTPGQSCCDDFPCQDEVTDKVCYDDFPCKVEVTDKVCSDDFPCQDEVTDKVCSDDFTCQDEVTDKVCSDDFPCQDEVTDKVCSDDFPCQDEVTDKVCYDDFTCQDEVTDKVCSDDFPCQDEVTDKVCSDDFTCEDEVTDHEDGRSANEFHLVTPYVIHQYSPNKNMEKLNTFETLKSAMDNTMLFDFILVKSENCIKLIKLYPSEIPAIQMSVVIGQNLQPVVTVHNIHVPYAHELFWGSPSCFSSIQHVTTLLEKLNSLNVCIGNPDEEYRELIPVSASAGDISSACSEQAFREGEFGAVQGMLRYHSTIRTHKCHLLVNGIRCIECSKFRYTLRRSREREEKHKRLPLSSKDLVTSKKQHSRMKREELIEKCIQLRSYSNSLETCIEKLKGQINRDRVKSVINLTAYDSMQLGDLEMICESDHDESV